MAITDWPKQERPREKLLTHGAQTLSDAELLAIFLRTGVKGKTAVDLSRDLLEQFGGLRDLLSLTHHQFCQQRGLGLAKYVQLHAGLEIGKRYLQAGLQRLDILNNATATRNFIAARLQTQPHEVFACLFLDSRNRIIRFEELFHGTIDNATVYPRVVARRALDHNAASVILAHNHPSGIAEPSEADKVLTQQLVNALALMDIRVLDHIIVGDGQTTSMAERGYL